MTARSRTQPATAGNPAHDVALYPWRCLSLCAGVGGLDLGVRLAEPAARSVCYVEREAAAASILVARMEDGWLHPAPVWSDLATFDAGAWRGAVDCIVSGDPCQPNSDAGAAWLDQRGAEDDRWLLDRVIDVVAAVRPSRVFRENVTGNADGQLAVLVPRLEGLGFRVAVGIFSAAEVGAPHDRERLFVMADAGGIGLQGRTVAGNHQSPGGESNRGVRLPEHLSKLLQIEVRGLMNPAWPEWLMGWPIGWTASEPLGTASCRWWPAMLGELSRLASRPIAQPALL